LNTLQQGSKSQWLNGGSIKGGKNAKHRQPGFYLRTTTLTKLMRRVCRDLMHRRSGALSPFQAFDIDQIKVFKIFFFFFQKIFILLKCGYFGGFESFLKNVTTGRFWGR